MRHRRKHNNNNEIRARRTILHIHSFLLKQLQPRFHSKLACVCHASMLLLSLLFLLLFYFFFELGVAMIFDCNLKSGTSSTLQRCVVIAQKKPVRWMRARATGGQKTASAVAVIAAAAAAVVPFLIRVFCLYNFVAKFCSAIRSVIFCLINRHPCE